MRKIHLTRCAAGAILLSAFALNGALQPAAAATSAGAPRGDELSFRGRITGWWVNDLGHVSIRLAAERENQTISMWFRTPADRAAATRLEDLTLETVLRLCDTDARINVLAERDESDHGRTRDEALELVGFGRL